MILSLLTGCMFIPVERGEIFSANVEGMSNPNVELDKFNKCYIDNDKPNDIIFQGYYKIIKDNIKDQGIEVVEKKSKANCTIKIFYSVSEPKTRNVNMPIMGRTGISSITTNSYSNYNAYGTASTYGNTTYGNIYGSGYTNSVSNVNYNYGITGFIPISVTTYDIILAIGAKSSKGVPLWMTYAVSNSSSNDLGRIFPYLAVMVVAEAKRNTSGRKNWSIAEDELYYNNYEYNGKIYRFYDKKDMCEAYSEEYKIWHRVRCGLKETIIKDGRNLSLSKLIQEKYSIIY